MIEGFEKDKDIERLNKDLIWLNKLVVEQALKLKEQDTDLKNLNKTIERLQEQLKEAQNLIIYCSSGDHLGYEIQCENYMHRHHLSKWGVK